MKFTSVASFGTGLVALLAGSEVALAASIPSSASVNPFLGRDVFLSPVYSKEVAGAIVNFTLSRKLDLAAKAWKVAQIPTFIWISERAAVSSISGYLLQAKLQSIFGKQKIVQLVVYDLPDRDCSAKASDGEFHLNDGGEEKYKEYIQAIRSQISKYPSVPVVITLEPDSLGNLVTNLAVEKCANAASAYKTLLAYAVANLGSLPNVNIYIDGAHSAWLGWPDNLGPTAQLLGQVLSDAKAINPKAKVRGVVTDVSNYNGLGNQEQQGYDELVYAQNLAPLLEEVGFPAHFIVDQGRSGNQVATRDGGDWCNLKTAGIGRRPTTSTPSPLIDAIVWVKPPGETDGTSDTASPRYDTACTSATSFVPSPEAGTFYLPIFESLIRQANPPL